MMKIKPEHVEHMRQAFAKLDTDFYRSRYAAAGLSDMRYQWDLLRAAGLMPWLCDTIYAYANDDHINTALRRIVKPLERAESVNV